MVNGLIQDVIEFCKTISPHKMLHSAIFTQIGFSLTMAWVSLIMNVCFANIVFVISKKSEMNHSSTFVLYYHF